jgi:activator of HSP90 ATPase
MKTIHQKHHITAPPDEVYLALTNPFTIELWTGYPSEMSVEPGSEFSLFDGDIVGKNLDFKTNELIRQQWYFEGEEKDSFVVLRLKAEKNNTVVELTHENVPDKVFEEMASGWKKLYFESLKRFFK